jgi:hypothetical protein
VAYALSRLMPRVMGGYLIDGQKPRLTTLKKIFMRMKENGEVYVMWAMLKMSLFVDVKSG